MATASTGASIENSKEVAERQAAFRASESTMAPESVVDMEKNEQLSVEEVGVTIEVQLDQPACQTTGTRTENSKAASGRQAASRASESALRVGLYLLAAFSIGAAVTGVPLGVLYANRDSSTASTTQSSTTSSNTCWRPLTEMDGHGFLFGQRHVAGFLQDATDSMLVMNNLPSMSLAPGGNYDYPAEVDLLIAKMASVTTQAHKDEISFFDGKLNIALGIIGTLLLGYGQSIEEILFHSFGETTAVYDSGVAVWKNKLMNSRIRPTTVLQGVLVIAYEIMFFKIRDGWNMLGVDGGCDYGAHFCHRYADITNYDPEVGVCLQETLSA